MSVQFKTFIPLIPPYVEEKILDHLESRSLEKPSEIKEYRLRWQKESTRYIEEIKTMPQLTDRIKLVLNENLNSSPIFINDGLGDNNPHNDLPSVISFSPYSEPIITKYADETDLKCYKYAQKVDYFFREVFKINPVLPPPHKMIYVLNYGPSYNNAAWIGNSCVFGGVHPKMFAPLVNDFMIHVHEWGHAVTQHTANLAYEKQSGALNESISDMFAITAEHFYDNVEANSPDANWSLAKIVKNKDAPSSPLRSLSHPGSAYDHPILGKDRQCSHMNEYQDLPVNMEHDFGGVHIYSGIPNKAFYLAATSIGGNSWGIPGQIWFRALLSANTNDNFESFAKHTIEIAASEHGQNISNCVAKAWSGVGVFVHNFNK